MQIPLSDADFYERKIFRLEKDIALLNQELNVSRGRLRSAQDFQIKYQLLLRQSQQQNLLMKKKEDVQKAKFNEIMIQEVEKINQEWIRKMQNFQQLLASKHSEQRQQLLNEIDQLNKKIKETIQKSQQIDSLQFKNKKIAKDLQALEDTLEENRINNEKQRDEEVRTCRESVNKKWQQKMSRQKQKYEEIVSQLKEKNDQLQIELMKVGLSARENEKVKEKLSGSDIEQNITEKVGKQLEKLNNLLQAKNDEIELLQNDKMEYEQKYSEKIVQLKAYSKDLEQQLFNLHSNHEIELLNFKTRMEEARKQELAQKQKQYEAVRKEHSKDVQNFNQKTLKEKSELESTKKSAQTQITKLKGEKQKLQAKILNLKNRLRQYETNQEMGETQILINSLKHIDRKQDDMSGYQNGVTFLERQLRKTTIKLQRKNLEVQQLVNKINNINTEFEKEIGEVKQKYSSEIKLLNDKIFGLEDDIKEKNQQLRRRDKEHRDNEADYDKKINQLMAENRSLQNLNSDLQRDYNRILESKKLIQKSFREERERSLTSKSEIAVAKKQKWLELERQKHQIEIIYKEKQEQLKTNYQILLSELRVQNDKLKREMAVSQQQLQNLREKSKKRDDKDKDESEKQNVLSEYHKKLSTVNLEITLTENLYSELMKAKSRLKKHGVEKEIAESQLKPPIEVRNRRQTVRSKDLSINLSKQKSRRVTEVEMRQLDKLSSNESNKFLQSHRLQSEQPIYLDSDQLEQANSPTFKMMNSFNPKYK